MKTPGEEQYLELVDELEHPRFILIPDETQQLGIHPLDLAVECESRLCVEDEGPGLPDTANLFVPFFTTKPAGSGIGLALSRQIAEAHGGTLALENRGKARGCRATLRLPL